MPTNSVQLHRVIRAQPERIYRAFLEADAMAKWLPPYGFTCKVHHMEAKVGGTFKMSFTNFGTGNGNSFGGEYLELVPAAKICYTDKFDDPNLPGSMKTTITFKPVSCGTDMKVVQEGIPEVIPAEMCYWAGKSHWHNWPCWSSHKFRIKPGGPHDTRTLPVF